MADPSGIRVRALRPLLFTLRFDGALYFVPAGSMGRIGPDRPFDVDAAGLAAILADVDGRVAEAAGPRAGGFARIEAADRALVDPRALERAGGLVVQWDRALCVEPDPDCPESTAQFVQSAFQFNCPIDAIEALP